MGVQTHFKPKNTIRQALVSVKDKSSIENRSGVVYYVNCNECKQDYVGETARTLKYRFAEHRRPSNKKSPVQKHIKKYGHTFNWPEAAILGYDQDWLRRGVREAINIMKTNPVLNENRGRYDIPKVYHRLLDPGGEGEQDPVPTTSDDVTLRCDVVS